MRVTFPNEKKFEVYHAVESLKLSRREVAKRFGLSLTRVQQMMSDVTAFVSEYGSEDLLNVPPERRELVALRLCYERMSFFYRTIMRKYNALEASNGSTGPMVKLLTTASKLSGDQAKLAGRIAKVEQEMIEAGTLDYQQHVFEYEDGEEEETESATPVRTLAPRAADEQEVDDEDDSELTLEEAQQVAAIITKLGPDASSEQFFEELVAQGLVDRFEKTPVQRPR
jgi:hypothetical protein